ncbi:MAG TPA: type II toxin-antitoxin system VapC family toxin [Nitrososphaerales archaeon]|nr:type II toxin-antitoxin system VapC family toxin [Nitrososphaerales archaeon]
MKYVIDSFAWLEYFMGSSRGNAAKRVIDSRTEEAYTPAICVAEVYAKSLKTEGEAMAETRRRFMRDRSVVAPLNEERAVEAAKIDVTRKKEVHQWGLADSIVLATARGMKAKVLTGDHHFDGLQDVVMI